MIAPMRLNEEYSIPGMDMFITSNTPTLTIKKKRLLFNKKFTDNYSKFEQVEMLYHPIYRILCVRSSDKNTANAFSLIKDEHPVHDISAPVLSKILMGSLENVKMKIRGVFREYSSHAATFFHLSDDYQNVMNDISCEDLMLKAETVNNPLVGDLPSRQDIADEVEKLLYLL